MADLNEPAEETLKQSEGEQTPVVAETSVAQKRKRGKAELDENGKPIKAPRKPFEWTVKRQEAFLECKRKRSLLVAERKRLEAEAKLAEKQVRQQIRSMRESIHSDQRLILSSPEQLINSALQRGSLSSTPVSAPDLTVYSAMPNVMPPETMLNQQEVVTQPLQTQMQTQELPSQTQMQELPSQMPSQTPTQTQTQTQMLTSQMPTQTQRELLSQNLMEEEDVLENLSEMKQSLQVIEKPISGLKRKNEKEVAFTNPVAHSREKINEDDFSPNHRQQQYQRGQISVDDLSDEELTAFLYQAREAAEERNLFNTRRTQGKMVRPSHASMFLDHAYVHESTNHPSSLVSRSLPRQPQGQYGAGAGHTSSNYTWL
jgi:hypothetical protein